MSFISDYIENKNKNGEKVLSIFLTSGFPDPKKFKDFAVNILNAGADMLEIGFPFSDPLADGPTIQHSSQIALASGINLKKTFEYVKEIKSEINKPIILMGYANPVLQYGLENFSADCKKNGVDGLIIPDVPIDEFDNFFTKDFDGIDKILLATPTTSDERVKKLDEMSEGFVYYVSMTGTTGSQVGHDETIMKPLKRVASLIKRNKMLIGFGISNEDDAETFAPFCSGVIVGSAIIKSIEDDGNFATALNLVKNIKRGLTNKRVIRQTVDGGK